MLLGESLGSLFKFDVGGSHPGTPPGVRKQGFIAVGQVLGEVADSCIRWGKTDGPFAGCRLSGDHPHQGGFAGTVWTDDGDDGAGREDQVQAGKESTGAERGVKTGNGHRSGHGSSLQVKAVPSGRA